MTPEPPPCVLPRWPDPPVMGGVPHGDAMLVTRDGVAELGRYIAGVLIWAESAGACIPNPVIR